MAILRTKNPETGKWEETPTIAGKNGKTAYQYALEGGFTGTETEFMQKLAIESYSKGEADAKFLTTESDPTVPAWAKAATKPTYTAVEVGADEQGAAAAALVSANAHTDTHANKKDNPHGVTAAQVGADAAGSAAAALDEAKKYTDGEIAELINGAPTTLDTLGEIATAMAENADVVAALHEAIGNKADAQTVAALQTAVAGKAESSAVSALETTVNAKAAASDLTAHTNNKNNPHGVTAAQVGTYTKEEINAALSKKTDDFSLEINNNATGTGDVKFATIDYSTCDSNNGVSALIRMRSGHGNGKSFVFSQDVYLHVNYDGTVRVDNRKHYDSYVGKYDDVNHQYGDIFWVVDTDNKIVDFYCLVGQWSRLHMTPWARIANSSKGTLTQHTTRILYSDGAKEWANNSVIVVKSDIPSWAMKASKPSYDASEVGALPIGGGSLTGAITLPNNTAVKSNDGNGAAQEVLRANGSNQIVMGANGVWDLIVSYHGIVPATSAVDTLDLGAGARRWRNLYLSGSISDGTNSVKVADIAKKSDIPTVPDKTENWTFTLEDGSTVTKAVYIG